jgi:hypothetical protein
MIDHIVEVEEVMEYRTSSSDEDLEHLRNRPFLLVQKTSLLTFAQVVAIPANPLWLAKQHICSPRQCRS